MDDFRVAGVESDLDTKYQLFGLDNRYYPLDIAFADRLVRPELSRLIGVASRRPLRTLLSEIMGQFLGVLAIFSLGYVQFAPGFSLAVKIATVLIFPLLMSADIPFGDFLPKLELRLLVAARRRLWFQLLMIKATLLMSTKSFRKTHFDILAGYLGPFILSAIALVGGIALKVPPEGFPLPVKIALEWMWNYWLPGSLMIFGPFNLMLLVPDDDKMRKRTVKEFIKGNFLILIGYSLLVWLAIWICTFSASVPIVSWKIAALDFAIRLHIVAAISCHMGFWVYDGMGPKALVLWVCGMILLLPYFLFFRLPFTLMRAFFQSTLYGFFYVFAAGCRRLKRSSIRIVGLILFCASAIWELLGRL